MSRAALLKQGQSFGRTLLESILRAAVKVWNLPLLTFDHVMLEESAVRGSRVRETLQQIALCVAG